MTNLWYPSVKESPIQGLTGFGGGVGGNLVSGAAGGGGGVGAFGTGGGGGVLGPPNKFPMHIMLIFGVESVF